LCIFRTMQGLQPHILILPKWYPHQADPQNGSFIQTYTRALAKRQPVTVIFPEPVEFKRDVGIFAEEDLLEIHVPFVRSNVPVTSLRKAINFFRYRQALLTGLEQMRERKGKPDLIHAQVLIRPAMFAAHWANRWDIPWILTEHSSEFIREGALSGSKKFYIRNLCVRASRLVVVSDPLAEGLRAVTGRRHIDVIPNLIEFPEIPPGASTPRPVLTIGIVADLVDDIKNISGVLRALALVRKDLPEFELKIAGEGPDRQPLELLAKELGLEKEVEFFGSMTHSEVLTFLPSIDFLVLNSRTETFSIVTAEAVSCGKPVIITRCGGPEQWFLPEYGIMISPDNQPELEKALVKMAHSFREYPAEKIAQDVRTRFNPDQIIESYRLIYAQLIKK